MEAEAHRDLVPKYFLLQPGVLLVFKNVLKLVDLGDDLEEAEQSHICDLTIVQ